MVIFLLIILSIFVGCVLNICIAKFTNEKISLSEIRPWYFLSITAINAMGWLLVYNIYGLTTRCLTGLFVFSFMLIITAIDLEKHIIPNEAVIFFLIAGIIYHFVLQEISLGCRLIGLFTGLATPILMAIISRGGIGGGDIKLLGAMGFWVGFPGILCVFFVSSLAGGIISLILLVIGRKKQKDSIAFAPYLVLGFLLLLFFPSHFRSWY